MSEDWRKSIPADEWEVYERAGFGRSVGLGEKPALLIIDVQYRTVGDEPLPLLESIERFSRTSCGEAGWAAVTHIEELVEAARGAGRPVVYPYVAPKAEIDAGRTGQKVPSLMEVADEAYRFVDRVAPAAGDLLIPKRHPSAFFGTPLVSYLIDLDVDTLLLTGCTTSGCVRATAVDAFAYNFKCAVVEEAVYDRSRLSHDVNLFDIQAKYADVITTAEAKQYLASLKSDTSVPAVASHAR
jgi:nicotinamidase-related amidase